MAKSIAVVAANGHSGQLIVKEALERGYDVTVFVRSENRTPAKKAVIKDIMELTAQDLEGFDAVVDAFGAWTPETLPQHSTTLAHLSDILSGSDTRLLVVGGAGSLYLNPEHSLTVAQSPDFPEAFKPLALAMGAALAELRKRDDVRWTYISPACDFQVEGERTGEYVLGGDELTVNERGESIISYADFTVAMLDEIESGIQVGQRFCVVRK